MEWTAEPAEKTSACSIQRKDYWLTSKLIMLLPDNTQIGCLVLISLVAMSLLKSAVVQKLTIVGNYTLAFNAYKLSFLDEGINNQMNTFELFFKIH